MRRREIEQLKLITKTKASKPCRLASPFGAVKLLPDMMDRILGTPSRPKVTLRGMIHIVLTPSLREARFSTVKVVLLEGL